MIKKDVIVYIDESEEYLDLMPKRLQALFGADVDIVAIEPLHNIDETMNLLIDQYQDACALVLDERMQDLGTAIFNGSELALAYREITPELPIYILTSHPTDSAIAGVFSAYDYVIDKAELQNKDIRPELISVIRRNIGRYKAHISERSQELHELLEKSVLEGLNESESVELSQLLIWKRTPDHLSEHNFQQSLKLKLDERMLELDSIEKRINELNGK